MKRLFALGLWFALLLAAPTLSAQTLLPNGQQQFADSNGQPLAGGSVYFYVPGTTTAKFTYQNPGLTTPNTNPVVLNAAGRAVIWGSGLYREVVYDSSGNLVWDQLTTGQGSLPVASRITTSTSIAACAALFPVVAGAPLTINLPSAPNVGDSCQIADAGYTAASDNITISAGSQFLNIGGHSLVMATNGQIVTLTWLGSPAVWLVNTTLSTQSVNSYFALDTGTVNAMAVTLSPAPANQAALIGIPIYVSPANTNSADYPTLNVNSFGALQVGTVGTTGLNPVRPGTFAAAKIITVVYDGVRYQYLDRMVTASTADVNGGVEFQSPITPAGLRSAAPYSLTTTAGYQQMPGNGVAGSGTGPLIEWGVITPASGDQETFSFPVSFVHGTSIVANVLNGASNVEFVTISFNNNAQAIFSVWGWNGSSWVNVSGHAIHWMAMGY